MKLVSVISWIFILIIGTNTSESSKAPQHEVTWYAEKAESGLNPRPAKLGEFPFVVFLCRKYQQMELLAAAGAILNKDWVLTVAHVLHSNISHVHAGVTEQESPNAQVRDVSKQLMHPDYNPAGPKPMENDVGLVKVSKPFDFNQNVKFVPMYRNTIEEGRVDIMAFGPRNLHRHEIPKTALHVFEATPVLKWYCKDAFPDSVICTKTRVSIVGRPCHLGVGTLLVYNNSVGGLDLLGPPCAIKMAEPFTPVSLFTKWVETTMEKN